MTDPITCPQCQGRKGQRYGALFLACPFCQGRGWVGGEHEPAEQAPEPPDGPPPVWQDRRWRDPVVAEALGCPYCFGSGQVTHVDRERGALVTVACSCATSS